VSQGRRTALLTGIFSAAVVSMVSRVIDHASSGKQTLALYTEILEFCQADTLDNLHVRIALHKKYRPGRSAQNRKKYKTCYKILSL